VHNAALLQHPGPSSAKAVAHHSRLQQHNPHGPRSLLRLRIKPRSYVPHVAPPYQGVAIRFVAILIDTIIIAIIGGILSVPFNALAVITNSASGTVTLSLASAVGGLVSLAIFVLYFTLLEGHYGQTVGKMAVKIKVVRETDGAPIDYSEAAVRTILRFLDLIPYIIPYLLGAILIWSSEEKQRLGDRVAHTVVIKA
jgi:uncharacterized RDD family membrane protein YckC